MRHPCQPAVLLPTRAASVCPVHALAAAQRDVSRRQLKQLLIFLLVPLGQESPARAILQGGKRCIGTVSVRCTARHQPAQDQLTLWSSGQPARSQCGGPQACQGRQLTPVLRQRWPASTEMMVLVAPSRLCSLAWAAWERLWLVPRGKAAIVKGSWPCKPAADFSCAALQACARKEASAHPVGLLAIPPAREPERGGWDATGECNTRS